MRYIYGTPRCVSFMYALVFSLFLKIVMDGAFHQHNTLRLKKIKITEFHCYNSSHVVANLTHKHQCLPYLCGWPACSALQCPLASGQLIVFDFKVYEVVQIIYFYLQRNHASSDSKREGRKNSYFLKLIFNGLNIHFVSKFIHFFHFFQNVSAVRFKHLTLPRDIQFSLKIYKAQWHILQCWALELINNLYLVCV